MRKKLITLCLAALCVLGAQAKKVYADLSADQTIGAGKWTASTNTFSWTASTNARMLLTGLTGDLSEYTSLVLESSDYTDGQYWRVDFIAGDKTIKEVEGTKFYSAGTKTINLQNVFKVNDNIALLKDVKEVRVNANSGNGSIVINKAYLVKPLASLEFNEEGIATVDFTDLEASGLTFDETTGEVKSESTSSSTLSLSLPATGLDMSKVARITMEYEGDNFVDNLLMNDADGNKITQAYSSMYNLDYSKVANNTKPVAKMTWTIKKEGTMTIKAIKFYSKTFGEKYTLTVTDAGASTLVLPYAVTIPDGVKAYTLTYTSGTNVNATTLTSTIPANTPVLINAATGEYEFARTDGSSTVPTLGSTLQTKDALIGQYLSGFTAPKDSYVLQKNKDGKLGFYKVAEDNKQEILPFRAYLKIEAKEAANMPASLSINFDDEPFDGTTGISEVEKSEKVPNGRRYNLSGVEVSDQYKGIVIVDGKKYIIK